MPPAPEFNDWTVTFLTPLPPWAVAGLVLLLLAAVISAHLGLRGERRRWRRWTLTGLRTLAVLALLGLVLEPALQLLQVRRVKNRVAVLVDTSSSMGLPAGERGRTRLQEAQALLGDTGWFEALSDRFVFDFAAFDKAVWPSDQERLRSLDTPEGRRTDLLGALEAMAAGTGTGGSRRLAGVLLLTDGADTELLSEAVGEGGEGLDPAVRERLEALGAPVHPFVAGRAGEIRDVAVARVRHDDFAFVRNAIEVEAVLRQRGFGGRSVPVVLRREGRVVSSRNVTLSEEGETRVTFRFTPDTTGKFVYTVSVPVLAGEAVETNNQRAFTLKVIRDRVRVLQVAGQPSWDVRFLRGHLERDPNVDLISFFILRTRQDDTVSNSDLSLIPFPTTELFTQELKTFDLVVFQNFDYLPYDMAQYLDEVRRYVEEGGAFVMIGGAQSFSEGRYDGTYIEDLLPVTLLPHQMDTLDAEAFTPRLTDEGRRHPIMQLDGTAGGADQLLRSLPELQGVNRVRAVKPEGQVLMEHPFLDAEGGNAPVVVAGTYGRGRTMAVTTDSTWFWSLPAAGQGAERRVYDRFWNNALRWLVRDPELTNVRVRPVKEAFEPGEPVVLEVSVRDRDYGPAQGAPVRVEVRDADGRQVAVEEAVTGADGTATVEVAAGQATGAFKATAEARTAGGDGGGDGGGEGSGGGGTGDGTRGGSDSTDAAEGGGATLLGRESTVFLVRSTSAEQVDPAPRPELLEAVAEATDGEMHALPLGALPDLSFVDPEVVEVGRKKNVDLWDRWWWLAALVGLVATEWILRRRWGQP